MNGRRQIPSKPENWLYQDWSENERIFAKEVFLSDKAKPWKECSNEEKEKWEEEHKQLPPVEEENKTEE